MTLQQFNDRIEQLRRVPQCRLNADQLLTSATLQRTILNAGFDLQNDKATIQRLPLSFETRQIAENKKLDMLLLAVLHWIEHGIILRMKTWRRT
jgi:hypothetical protein